MDGTTGRPEGAGSHIWLRYTTQFPVGERVNTIEMGIPVPLGASEEERERLLREAEAGMDQLAKHVESRAARMQQTRSGQASGGAPAAKPSAASVPTPPSAPAVIPMNRAAPAQGSIPAGTPSPRPPAQVPSPPPPPPREAPRGGAGESREKTVPVPPSRPSIAASMPSTPGLAGSASESMRLPQFIQSIKEKLNLTPKEAMDKLNVKSLNGVNLREAFEQLQHLANRQEGRAAPAEQGPAGAESEAQVVRASSPAPGLATSKPGSDILEIKHAVVREMPPAQAFDEELDDVEFDLELDEDEEGEYSSELTENERDFAENMLSKLREARGSSVASAQRLQALNNVVGEQLSKEQLLELIQGVWNISTLNKLKNEQNEALISWAKQDAFVEEAEVVLALLQENAYARSDR
jgi:hypothetical protein